ncbi:hypothetical protein D3C78_1572340 [compost metagenome]
MLGQHRAETACGDDQRWQQDGPGQREAQQQAQQDAIVAEQPGLPVGLGVTASLGREQPGHPAQQRTAEQGGRSEQDRQQAQQAAQRMALEEDLAEAVEQGGGPVGAGGVGHD